MATFREYIASLGAAGAVPEAELDELLGRYEWFALARLVRLRQRGGRAGNGKLRRGRRRTD